MPRLLAPLDMSYVEIESPFAQYPLVAPGGVQIPVTGLTETPVGLVGPGPLSLDLASVSIHPAAAWVASNSSYFTITVNRRTNAAPATPVAIAIGTGQVSGTNAMGSGVQWKGSNLFLQTGAGSFLTPLDALTVVVTETGGGLVIPVSFMGIYLKGT